MSYGLHVLSIAKQLFVISSEISLIDYLTHCKYLIIQFHFIFNEVKFVLQLSNNYVTSICSFPLINNFII